MNSTLLTLTTGTLKSGPDVNKHMPCRHLEILQKRNSLTFIVQTNFARINMRKRRKSQAVPSH